MYTVLQYYVIIGEMFNAYGEHVLVRIVVKKDKRQANKKGNLKCNIHVGIA